jgi:pimeloyl-ACP methyl ester carboxylesterase
MFAEYYAARHPEQIAGLILEESRPAQFTRACEAAQIAMCAPTVAMMRFAPQGAQAETAALADTASEVEGAERLAGKRVLVLSRFTSPDPKPFETHWAQLQARLAARYRGSTHLTAPAGGHYVHRDQQAWFLSAVLGFL